MAAGVVYLVLASLFALLTLNAWFPVRRAPLSVVSFFVGWVPTELALQCVAVEAVVLAVLAPLGALRGWEGWLGLALSAASCAGLFGMAVLSVRARGVVADGLAAATPAPIAAPVTGVPRALWGRWGHVAAAVPVRGRLVQVHKDLDYWGDGIDRHRLDVLTPRRPPADGRPAPVLVYIHGGGWIVGHKREQGKPMLYELASHGWVGVSINYRLSPKATWPDQIVDCKRALAWVKDNIAAYGGDPSFVAVGGGSAGGHLCALAALTANQPEWQPGFEDADTSVAACVPFYGVMDMTGGTLGGGPAPQGPEPPGGRVYHWGMRRLLETRVMKVGQAEHPEVFAAASPIVRVHPEAPPFLVFHGTNDTLVPVATARRFVDALRAASRAPVAYVELPRAQHAFDVLASIRCQATTLGTLAFLEAVRAAHAAPAA